MKNLATETKVGIFVILGIAILTFFTLKVGRIAVREAGYRVYTHVESAAGLDKNSPVRIAGVEVGKVESIVLDGTKAKVTLRLPLNVKIPAGSKLFVKSAGLLGEKYIEIAPGPGPGVVQADAQVEEGGPSVDVDRVLTQLSTIGEDIKSVTHSLSQSLGGKEGEKSLQEIVAGARDTVSNLEDITQSINRGQGTIGKLVKDEALYRQTQETVANLSQVAKSIERGEGTLGKLVKDEALYNQTKKMMEEAQNTFANLNQVAQKVEGGEGTLGKLVKDDALYLETKATMVEARETLGNLNKVAKQIEEGKGTLGKLATDEALYDDTRRAIKAVNKAADGISEVTPVTVLGVILGTVIK
jgi:phospholipid/cholesterol/gamma-HCH transport system substrate-binding protein